MENIRKTWNESSGTYKICVEKDNNFMELLVNGSGELCWNMLKLNKESNSVAMEISDNEYLKELLKKLFEGIIKENVLMIYWPLLRSLNQEERESKIKELMINGQLVNKNIESNPLIDRDRIEWHSDDFGFYDSDVLEIIRTKEDYKVIISRQDKNRLRKTVSVQISNSGSRYAPFNEMFMDLFNSLQTYDEIKTNNPVLKKQL